MRSLPTMPNDRTILLISALSILLMRLVAVIDGRDPGHDMSMLMANLPLAGFADYFRPLPLFEQTTTLGHLFIIDTATKIFGDTGFDRLIAVRAIAALASLLGLFFMFMTLRRYLGAREIALILILATWSEQAQWYASNEKQYVFGFMSSALLIWMAHRYDEMPGFGNAALFVFASVVAAVFAFSAPIIVAMVGGGLLIATLIRMFAGERGFKDVVQLAILGAFSIAPALFLYLVYTTPVTEFDLAAYAIRDEESFLTLSDGLSDQNITNVTLFVRFIYKLSEFPFALELFKFAGFMRPALHGIFLATALLGFVVLLRRSALLSSILVMGFAVCFTLNALHLLPNTATRHFMFLIPVTVTCYGLGIATVLAFLLGAFRAGDRAVGQVFAGVALVAGVFGIVRAATLEEHEVSAHLARVTADQAPLWVYYGGQPSMMTLKPPVDEFLGLIPAASDNTSWYLGARQDDILRPRPDYFENARSTIAGRDHVYLLFVHYWPEARFGDGLEPWVEMAEDEIGPCTRFDDIGTVLFDCRKN